MTLQLAGARKLAAVLALACAAWAASPSLVQQVGSVSMASGTSTAVTFGSSTTAGNLLVATLLSTVGSSFPAMSVSDSQGNSWSCPQTQTASFVQESTVCYAVSTSGGADTVTMSIAGGTSESLYVLAQEYSGLATASPLDTSASSTLQNGSTLTTPGVTTATANDFLIAIISDGGSTAGSFNCSAPWTAQTQANLHDPVTAKEAATSAGAYSGATCTIQFSTSAQGFTYAFKTPATATAAPCSLTTTGAGGCTPTPTPVVTTPLCTLANIANTACSAMARGVLTLDGVASVAATASLLCSPPFCASVQVQSASMTPGAEILPPQIVIEDISLLQCTTALPCAPFGSAGGKWQNVPDWSGHTAKLIIGLPGAVLATLGLTGGINIGLEK